MNRGPSYQQKRYWLRGTSWSFSLQWRHNGLNVVSNHQPHHRLLSCLFGRWSKKTSKLRVTGLCAGNSPGTGEFPVQIASNAENVSIWLRHYVLREEGFQNIVAWGCHMVTVTVTQNRVNIGSANGLLPDGIKQFGVNYFHHLDGEKW